MMKIKQPCKPVVCADGFTVSIQGSQFHYCEPREDYPQDGYTSLELGFPSAEDPLIQEYAETPSKPTDTVYPGVPLRDVCELIANHGGLVSETPLPEGLDHAIEVYNELHKDLP